MFYNFIMEILFYAYIDFFFWDTVSVGQAGLKVDIFLLVFFLELGF